MFSDSWYHASEKFSSWIESLLLLNKMTDFIYQTHNGNNFHLTSQHLPVLMHGHWQHGQFSHSRWCDDSEESDCPTATMPSQQFWYMNEESMGMSSSKSMWYGLVFALYCYTVPFAASWLCEESIQCSLKAWASEMLRFCHLSVVFHNKCTVKIILKYMFCGVTRSQLTVLFIFVLKKI